MDYNRASARHSIGINYSPKIHKAPGVVRYIFVRPWFKMELTDSLTSDCPRLKRITKTFITDWTTHIHYIWNRVIKQKLKSLGQKRIHVFIYRKGLIRSLLFEPFLHLKFLWQNLQKYPCVPIWYKRSRKRILHAPHQASTVGTFAIKKKRNLYQVFVETVYYFVG